jgi:hypothetical protein
MPKKASKSGSNKADFVRSLPNKTAAEVVAEGAKAGLTFKEKYVYVVRSADKARKSKAKAPAKNKVAAKGKPAVNAKSLGKDTTKKGGKKKSSKQPVLGDSWWAAYPAEQQKDIFQVRTLSSRLGLTIVGKIYNDLKATFEGR